VKIYELERRNSWLDTNLRQIKLVGV
jgi:hypothetical protein